jgi:hypothetical protein
MDRHLKNSAGRSIYAPQPDAASESEIRGTLNLKTIKKNCVEGDVGPAASHLDVDRLTDARDGDI